MDWLTTSAYAQAETAAQAAATAGKAADTIIAQGGIYGSIAVIAALAATVVIVALGLTVRVLWNTIKDRDALMGTLQESWRKESREIAAVAESCKASIATAAVASNSVAEALQDINDTLRPVAAGVEVLVRNQEKNTDRLERNGDAIGQVGVKLDRLYDQRDRA